MHGPMTMAETDEADWFTGHRLHGTDKHAIDMLKRHAVAPDYPLIVDLKATPVRKLSHGQGVLGVVIMQPLFGRITPAEFEGLAGHKAQPPLLPRNQAELSSICQDRDSL